MDFLRGGRDVPHPRGSDLQACIRAHPIHARGFGPLTL